MQDDFFKTLSEDEKKNHANLTLEENLTAIIRPIERLTDAEIIKLAQSIPGLETDVQDIKQVLKDFLIERGKIREGDNPDLAKLISDCENCSSKEGIRNAIGHLSVGGLALSPFFGIPGLGVIVAGATVVNAVKTLNALLHQKQLMSLKKLLL